MRTHRRNVYRVLIGCWLGAVVMAALGGRAATERPRAFRAVPRQVPAVRPLPPPPGNAAALSAVGERTLLDEVGRLGGRIPEAQAAGWKNELRRGHLAAGRAAGLHLWVGEYELAQNQQPERAIWHFRQARRLSGLAS